MGNEGSSVAFSRLAATGEAKRAAAEWDALGPLADEWKKYCKAGSIPWRRRDERKKTQTLIMVIFEVAAAALGECK